MCYSIDRIMRSSALVVVLTMVAAAFTSPASAQHASPLTMWYDEPAGDVWERALPIGNGRLGAMVYGNPEREELQLNENTVWAGGPYRNDNPEARQSTAKVRGLLVEGNHAEAQELADRKSTRLNSSHVAISYAVFCLKKKTQNAQQKYHKSLEGI